MHKENENPSQHPVQTILRVRGKMLSKRKTVRASTHFAKWCKKGGSRKRRPTFIGELKIFDDESVVRPFRLLAEPAAHVDFLHVVLQPLDRQDVLGVPDDLARYLQGSANSGLHVFGPHVDRCGRNHLQAAAVGGRIHQVR